MIGRQGVWMVGMVTVILPSGWTVLLQASRRRVPVADTRMLEESTSG